MPGSGRVGDQHVQVLIEVPRRLSKRQRELLEEFAATEEKHVTPERKGFIEKVKEYFAPKES